MASLSGLSDTIARLRIDFEASTSKAEREIARINAEFEEAVVRAKAAGASFDDTDGTLGRLRDAFTGVGGEAERTTMHLRSAGKEADSVGSAVRSVDGRLRDARGRFTALGSGADEAGAGLGRFRDTVRETDGVWRDADGRLRDARGRFAALGADADGAGRGVGGLGGAMNGLSGHARDLRTALTALAFPAIVAGFASIAGALASVAAGAVGLIAALAPLTGLLGALPGVALAAGAGLGSVLLATAGVGDALKAMAQRDQNASKDAAAAAQRRSAAADATRAAVERLRAAQAGVADAEENANRRVIDALRGVRDAHDTLSDAQRRAREAQQALTDARIEARQRLVDLRAETERLGLSEERAALSVEQARIRMQASQQAGSTATALERKDAELSYREAVANLTDIQRRRIDANRQLRDANRAGVNGAKNVREAQQGVADAQRNVARAAERLALAQQGVAQAQRDGARQVAAAQRQVTDALREQQKAARASMEQSSTSATKLAQAMAKLSPAGAAFVRQLYGMRSVLDRLRQTAQGAVLPGFGAALQSLVTLAPTFNRAIERTGQVIGNLAAAGARMIASGPWRRDFASITESNARVMDDVGRAGLSVADGLRHVAVAAEPLVEWLGKLVRGWADNFDAAMRAGRENGTLARFFDATRQSAERLFSIVGNVTRLVIGILKAAFPMGSALLVQIDKLTGGWADWIEQVRNSDRVRGFFDRAGKALHFVGQVIGTVVAAAGQLIDKLITAGAAIDDFAQRHPQVTKLAGALSAVAGVVYGLSRIGGLKGVFSELFTMLKGVPYIGIAVAVLTALATAFTFVASQSKPLRDAIGTLLKTIGSVAMPLFTKLRSVLTDQIIPAFQAAGRWAGKYLALGVKEVTDAIRDNRKSWKTVIDVIGAFAAIMYGKVAPALLRVVGLIGAGFVAALGGVIRLIAASIEISKKFYAAWVDLGRGGMAVLRGLIGAVASTLRPVVDAVGGAIQRLLDGAASIATRLHLPIAAALRSAAGDFSGYRSAATTALASVAQATKDQGDFAGASFGEVRQQLRDTGDAHKRYADAVKAAKQAQIDAVTANDKYKEALGQQRDAVLGVVPAFRQVQDGSKLTAKQLLADLQGSVTTLTDWQKNMQTLLKRGLDPKVLSYLAEQGPQYVAAFANGSDAQLKRLEGLYKERTTAATNVATTQTKLGGGQAADAYSAALDAKKAAIAAAAHAAMVRPVEEKTAGASKAAGQGGGASGQSFADSLAGKLATVTAAATNIVLGARDRLAALIGAARTVASNAMGALLGALRTGWTTTWRWMSGIGGSAARAISNLGSSIAGVARNAMAAMWTQLKTDWTTIRKWATGIPGSMATAIGGLASAISNAIGTGLVAAAKRLDAFGNAIERIAKSAFGLTLNVPDTEGPLRKALGMPAKRRTGGPVPGRGLGDRTLLLAEPGEYVLPRHMVAAAGGIGALEAARQASAGRAPGTGEGEGARSGRDTRSTIAAIESIVRQVAPDATATSTYRPGAKTRSGAVSYHAKHQAVDFVSGNLLALWRAIASTGTDWAELIYSGAPWYIGRGKRKPIDQLDAGTRADHWDHVHVALAPGGGLGKALLGGLAGPLLDKAFNAADAGMKALLGNTAISEFARGGLNMLRGAAETWLAGVDTGVPGDFGGGNFGAPPGGWQGNSANRRIGQRMAAKRGWVGAMWEALNALIMGESGWNNMAKNPSSTAFGIGQFLDSTQREYGIYGVTDPVRQIDATYRRIAKVYGNPVRAYAFWRSHTPHWYGSGGVLREPVTGFGLHSGDVYHLAERGPEMVTPLGRGGGAGTTVTFAPGAIVINLPAGTPSETVSAVRTAGQELVGSLHRALEVRR